jgi:ribonuclease G
LKKIQKTFLEKENKHHKVAVQKEIIINASLNEVRIAITEDGRLAELFIEMPDKERSIGSIYYGRVTKVIQGINAAFINIGAGQDAFLHFSDVNDSYENLITDEEEEQPPITHEEAEQVAPEPNIEEPDSIFDDFNLDEPKEEPQTPAENLADTTQKQKKRDQPPTFSTKRSGDVQINLEQNQNIIVQVVREAYGSKGLRVSTRIGIPGRYVVLLPYENIIGISKKIDSFQERKRLRQLARTILPKGSGCIIRTAALGINENELIRDWESLINIWKEIQKKVQTNNPPMLLYQDMQLASSVIRDLFTAQVKNVHIDSKKHYKEIINYLKANSPDLCDKVVLYSGKEAIFSHFGVEKELELSYKRKLLLPSGGSIVIDQTEAMVIIDVNSGRAITEKQQEANAMKTNIEAAKEIARQIRLRDIGGMILIDFIDITSDKYKKKLYQIMRNAVSVDRAKTVIYPLTQLCIMQITRQRINQNIAEKLSETCPMCQGSGRIASKAVLLNQIERWLKNFRTYSKEFRLMLYVHPNNATYLTEGTISRIAKMMIKYFVKIKVIQNESIHIDQFKFFSVKRQKEITNEFI